MEFSAIPKHARLQPRRQLSEARILLYVHLFYQIRQLDVLLPQFRAGFLASYSAPSRRLSDFLLSVGVSDRYGRRVEECYRPLASSPRGYISLYYTPP